MNHIYAILTVVFLSVLVSCNNGSKTETVASSSSVNLTDDASYALGMNVGIGLQADNLQPDINEFIKGMKDVLDDSQTRFTMERAYQILNEVFIAISEERENEYLITNSLMPGIMVTDSGLQYEILEQGDGPKPTAFDTVRVHYEGTLTNGTMFDSSYYRGAPIEFQLAGVIPGWTEGLQLMNVGSTYRLIIPSYLGYGGQGTGSIPPYSTLIFQVELLDIIN